MKLGLQLPRYPAAEQARGRLKEIAQTAEQAGFASIWLMDHLFQIRSMGKVDDPMLEAYTTLGYLAACTERVELGTLVTAATYRSPGLLLKQVTTLDVLSGGRAWLGIGAGWYEREARGLGLDFPRLSERFERLEETLKIAQAMWQGSREPIYGRHHQLAEPINSPTPLHRPRILIGGGGEKKTLRLVARYADACNLFGHYPAWKLGNKLDVLLEHCQVEGRDYDSIEKTVLADFNPGRGGAQKMIMQIGQFERLGFTTVIASLAKVETLAPLELVGREVIPALATGDP